MGYDAWKLQSPDDEPQFGEEELLAGEQEEALAEEEAAIWWGQLLSDERAAAEAWHVDAAPARVEAHRVFDRLWRSGQMKRVVAYRWMQKAMGLEKRRAHIALLSADECARLIALVKARYP